MPPGQMAPMHNCMDPRQGIITENCFSIMFQIWYIFIEISNHYNLALLLLSGVAGGAGPSPAPMGPGGPMPGMLPQGPHPRMGAGTPPTAASISGPQPSRIPQNVWEGPSMRYYMRWKSNRKWDQFHLIFSSSASRWIAVRHPSSVGSRFIQECLLCPLGIQLHYWFFFHILCILVILLHV